MWSLTEFAQTYSAMHAGFPSGIAVVTRLTALPHCASGTSPDLECQTGGSEILSVRVSQDLGQADNTE